MNTKMRYHESSEDRPTLAGVPAIRCHNGKVAGRPARSAPEATRRVEGHTRNARAEAKGQAFRFPRPWRSPSRLDSCRLRRSSLSSKFLPGQPLSCDLPDGKIEALSIVQLVAFGVLPIVVAESLLVQVPEQVEWFNADVCAVQPALQKRPEILHTVGVNVPANVLNGVIYNLMLELVQALIRLQGVGIQCRSSFDVLADFRLKRFLLAVLDNLGADLSAAFEDAHDGGFVLAASASDLDGPLPRVHVPRLATDEGFVGFDFSTKLSAGFGLKSKPDTLQHEPRSLLGNAQIAANLVAADAVLAVAEQPNSGEPLVQAERRIFKDGSDLDGELTAFVLDGALPNTPCCDVPGILAATSGAHHDAIRPAPSHQVTQAVIGIGKVDDCLFEIGWFSGHEPILTGIKG